MTDLEKKEFVKGFESAAPAGYDASMDDNGNNPCPWCAPWTWAKESSYLTAGATPFECGAAFARRHFDEIAEQLLAAEAEEEASEMGENHDFTGKQWEV